MKRGTAILAVLIMSVMVANSSWAQPPGDSPRGPAQRQARPFNPLLQFFDADADGTLSEDEISAASAKLKELDTSKDGSCLCPSQFGRRPCFHRSLGQAQRRPRTGRFPTFGAWFPWALPKATVKLAFGQNRQPPKLCINNRSGVGTPLWATPNSMPM
jgi:hypothetical protein